MPGPVQNLPGVTGVRQCLASGQQNSVARHGEMQAAPGVTQTLVSGQQTSPLPQACTEQWAKATGTDDESCMDEPSGGREALCARHGERTEAPQVTRSPGQQRSLVSG